MSDAAPPADKAALVIRCPTCKNHLPEPPGYSLFHCGGCGALLTANRRHLMSGKEMVEEAVYEGKDGGSIGHTELDIRIKLNGIGSASSVGETRDFVDGEGTVKVFPSKKLPRFNEIGNVQHFGSNGNEEIDGNRMSCFEEGPSKYMYNYDCISLVNAEMRNTCLQGSKRIENLEQDRLKLLRKLDELNNQLRLSGSLSSTTKEKGVVGRDLDHDDNYGIADAWMANDCLDPDTRNGTKQTFLDNRNLGGPCYGNYPDSYPYTGRPGQYMQSSYHHPHMQDETLRYGMRFESPMPRRPVPSVSSQYAAHPPNFPQYYPGQYVDADPDTFKPYQHNASFHHPSCSCFQCYSVHHNTMPSAPRSNFPDGTYKDMSSNRLAYHHKGPSSFYDTRPSTIGADDYNSRVGNYESYPIRRVVLSKVGRQCHPLLGGAPFATCHNCYEVLQLPIKLLKLKDHQNKLRCGACSTIISYFFQENKLLISDHSELKSESNFSEVMDEGIVKPVGPVNQSDDKFNSDNFDNLNNDFKLFGEGHDLRNEFCNLNVNETHDTNVISTSTASPSNTEEEECSQLNLKTQRNPRNTIAPPPGSPLQEHLDYSSSNHIIIQDEGNLSGKSDHEKIIPKAVVTPDQNALKEVASEMEVSFNGYSNSGISQDSGNGSKEEQHQEINRKDGFAGIKKKSFKEIIKLDQSKEGETTCVTINGHPISDRMIKKASRRAGRVHPGNYWYDVRAGFWGVMGGPCLGIIPPFIEEFNYPLSENCSVGTTGVFVNGRELHEKDLELLSGRGLPTTRDRSYTIEISGRVLDADSGKELDSLGRLARTVEKAKHGFGMKVPKQIVANKE